MNKTARRKFALNLSPLIIPPSLPVRFLTGLSFLESSFTAATDAATQFTWIESQDKHLRMQATLPPWSATACRARLSVRSDADRCKQHVSTSSVIRSLARDNDTIVQQQRFAPNAGEWFTRGIGQTQAKQAMRCMQAWWSTDATLLG